MMNRNKTVFTLVFSVSVILITAFMLIVFSPNPLAGSDLIESFLDSFFPKEGKIRINVNSVNRNFIHSVEFKDFEIFYDNELVLSCSSLKISAGLKELYQIYKGSIPKFLSVSLSGVKTYFTGENINLFLNGKTDNTNPVLLINEENNIYTAKIDSINTDNSESAYNANSENNERKDTAFFLEMLKKIEYKISITDADVSFIQSSTNISLNLKRLSLFIGKDFKIRNFTFLFDKLNFVYSDWQFNSESLSIFLTETGIFDFSFSFLSASNKMKNFYIQAKNGIFETSFFTVTSVPFIEDKFDLTYFTTFLDEIPGKNEAVFSLHSFSVKQEENNLFIPYFSTLISFDKKFKNFNLEANSKRIDLFYADLNGYDLNALTESSHALIEISDRKIKKIDIDLGFSELSYSDYSVLFNNFSGNVSFFNFNNFSLSGLFSKLYSNQLNNAYVDELSFDNLEIDCDNIDDLLKIKTKFKSMSGISSIDYISKFSMSGSINAEIMTKINTENDNILKDNSNFDEKNVNEYNGVITGNSNINFSENKSGTEFSNIKFFDNKIFEFVKNIDAHFNSVFLTIKEIDTLDFFYDSSKVELNMASEDFSSNFIYENRNTPVVINAFFSSFRLENYSTLVNRYLSAIAPYIGDKTEIDGSMYLSFFPDFDIFSGNYLFDLTVKKIQLLKEMQFDVSLIFDGNIKDGIVTTEKLDVSIADYEIIFSGLIDFNTYIPQGNFSVLNKKNQNNIIINVSSRLSDTKEYFYFFSELTVLGQATVEGIIEYPKENFLEFNLIYKNQYQAFPIRVELNLSDNSLEVNSSSFHAHFCLDDNKVLEANGELNNAVFYFSDGKEINVNLNFNGKYDFFSKNYEMYFKNVLINVSLIAYFGFDIRFSNNRIELFSLQFGRKENHYLFKGLGQLFYSNINDLINFRTSSFYGEVDLKEVDSDGYIKMYLTDDSYSATILINDLLNFRLALLGDRGSGFFADIDFENYSFFAEYKGKTIRIGNGSDAQKFIFGSFLCNSPEININFEDSSIIGSLFFNSSSEDLNFGGKLLLNAKIDSLLDFVLSYAGINEESSVEFGFEQVYIGSQKLDPFSVNLIYTPELLKFSGPVLNGFYNLQTKNFELSADKSFIISFNAKGFLNQNLDILITDIFFPLPLIFELKKSNLFQILDGTVEGELMITGSYFDPSMYGMLYLSRLEMELFWLPFQTIISNSLAISIHDHFLSAASTPAFGYSTETKNFFNATISLEGELQNLSIQKVVLSINDPVNPMVLWMPIILDETTNLNIRGLVTGDIRLVIGEGPLKIEGDIKADDLSVGFVLPEYIPDWFFTETTFCALDLNLITGKNTEFFYPDRDNSFLNITINEGEKIYLYYNPQTLDFYALGKLAFKLGRISYFQNDFYITDGTIKFSKPVGDVDKLLEISLDLTARLRQFDSNGNQIDIFLILQDANLDNIVPRFESSPSMSESEIMQILGRTIVPETSGGITLYSIANIASRAADTISTLGIIGSANNSLTSSIRESLGFDLFAIRSPVLENMVLSSLPGMKNNVDLVAAYLDGTSVFFGKYLFSDLFLSASLMIDSGNFSSINDININLEINVEWSNEIGSFSLFSKLKELSILNFLDNIGFSFSKRILL